MKHSHLHRHRSHISLLGPTAFKKLAKREPYTIFVQGTDVFKQINNGDVKRTVALRE